MATLVITRGLPGCGKTTFARAWVAEDREHRARVNRDDVRMMLDHGEFVKGVTEPRVIAARDAAILALLRKDVSVICDDTNLPQRVARDLARLASRAGATFDVVDMTGIPWKECITRDAARTDKKPVGGPVIVDMRTRYLDGRSCPLPLPEELMEAAVTGALYEPKPAPRSSGCGARNWGLRHWPSPRATSDGGSRMKARAAFHMHMASP